MGRWQGPAEKTWLPDTQRQRPRQEPVCGLATRLSCTLPVCSVCLPASRRDGRQAEEGAQERGQQLPDLARPLTMNPGLVTAQLCETLGPSCCQIDLVYQAVIQSRAEGSLARAGRTGRQRNFS